MKVIFVRHSEPDYSMLDRANNPAAYAGFGRDLAPLTEHGRHQAQEAAKIHYLLKPKCSFLQV